MAQTTVLLLQTSNSVISKLAGEVTGFSGLLDWIQGESVTLPQSAQFTFSVGAYSNVKLRSEAEFSSMLVLASISTPSVVTINVCQSSTQLPAIPTTTFPASCTALPNAQPPTTSYTNQAIPVQVYVNTANSTGNSTTRTKDTTSTRSKKLPNLQPASSHTNPPVSHPSNMQQNSTDGSIHHTTYNPDWICDFEDELSDGNFGSQQHTFSEQTDWDEVLTPPPLQQDITDKLSRKRASQKTSKARLKEKKRTGEWYPGATTAVPTYDISQEHHDIFLMSNGWGSLIKGVGQEFQGGAVEFRIELCKYASKLGFHYTYKRNDPKYITAECKHKSTDGCKWFVQGAVHSITKTLFIKAALLTHTCRFSIMRYDIKRMGGRVIGQIIQEQIREKPTMKPIDLKLQLATTHGFHLEYMQVWRGVEHARAQIFGCYHDSFDELRWYSHAIEKYMPGSVTVLQPEPVTNKFKRFFFAFKPCIDGFKFCRPMLFIDGTFMKNRYKGTVLTATAKDGNNGLYPVAIAIVSSENTENWVWFLNLVIQHVTHSQQIIYVSDRAGGILAAFDVISQKPYHFYCLWHLMKNLRDRYGNKAYTEKHRNVMCSLLKNLAYAPNERLYDEAMVPFINVGGEIARHFLKDLPKERWAVAFAPDLLRYGELTSSAAESFNSRIMEARSLNINHLVDTIRSIMNEWFVERAQEAAKHPSALTPAKEEAWNVHDNLSATWGIQMTNEEGTKFHVLSLPSAVVDLKMKTCSCWNWQITGFPCCHVVAVITRGRMDIRSFIEPYFFTDTWRKAYEVPLQPIPTTEKFEYPRQHTETRIEPPVIRHVPGRPQLKRFKKAKQPRVKKFKCDTCGQMGRHNRATCRTTFNDPPTNDPYAYNPAKQPDQPSSSCP